MKFPGNSDYTCVYLRVALGPVCIVWQTRLGESFSLCFLHRVFSLSLKAPLALMGSYPHPVSPGTCALQTHVATWTVEARTLE